MYTDVLDSTIVFTDILVPNQPYYVDFANSVCGFIIDVFPSLKYINGISIDLIRYLGTVNITCYAPNNIIDFGSSTNYSTNGIWSIPMNNLPNRGSESANYIGYYIYNGIEKIVIYGFFDENGYIKQIPGSLSSPISLYVDNFDWIVQNTTIDPNTNLPIIINRTIQFPVLTGCKIDALPARSDCLIGVIQRYLDFTNFDPTIILGDIPIVFNGNNCWYW